jgi:hypothetical protein
MWKTTVEGDDLQGKESTVRLGRLKARACCVEEGDDSRHSRTEISRRRSHGV